MTDTGDSNDSTYSERSSRGKVGRLIDRYELPGIGDELVEQWTRDDDRMSLRDLVDYFNESLVTRVLERNSASALDGEAANYYRLLTADDVSSGSRVQAKNRLERRGVDVEELTADFVSRQAIHTYLTKDRETTYEEPPQSEEERIDARLETIGRIRNRLASVAERAIGELDLSSHDSAGEPRVSVLVQVQCTECGGQSSITDYLSDNGCECRSSDQ